MSPDDRARYLAAYEAAYPGDIAARAKDEHDDIAEEMREVAEAADIDAAVSVLQSYEYGGGYLHLAKAARAMRAALGITDPPEPMTAAELAARLAEVERERDEARAKVQSLNAELSEAVQAAAIGEAVIAALHGEEVSEFMASMWPVAEAQSLHHTIALLQGDVTACMGVIKAACEPLRLLEDDEADWPKLAAAVARVVAERDEARAERDAARRLLGECYVLSGADPDGDGWEHHWPYAVQEVRELRDNYDALVREAADAAKGGA